MIIFLVSQMDWLEQVKTANADKEEITNEIVGKRVLNGCPLTSVIFQESHFFTF